MLLLSFFPCVWRSSFVFFVFPLSAADGPMYDYLLFRFFVVSRDGSAYIRILFAKRMTQMGNVCRMYRYKLLPPLPVFVASHNKYFMEFS